MPKSFKFENDLSELPDGLEQPQRFQRLPTVNTQAIRQGARDAAIITGLSVAGSLSASAMGIGVENIPALVIFGEMVSTLPFITYRVATGRSVFDGSNFRRE